MPEIDELKEEYAQQLGILYEGIPIEQSKLERFDSFIDDVLLMKMIDAYNLGKRIEALEMNQLNQ